MRSSGTVLEIWLGLLKLCQVPGNSVMQKTVLNCAKMGAKFA